MVDRGDAFTGTPGTPGEPRSGSCAEWLLVAFDGGGPIAGGGVVNSIRVLGTGPDDFGLTS